MMWIEVVRWWYAMASLATFLAYGFDKFASKVRGRRISEGTLLILGVVGGWPGAFLAVHLLRHKSAKRGYEATVFVTAAANCVLAFVILQYVSLSA